jgi:hypothetical protein
LWLCPADQNAPCRRQVQDLAGSLWSNHVAIAAA